MNKLEYTKEWRKRNKEKVDTYSKEYHQEKKEYFKEWRKEWLKNPENRERQSITNKSRKEDSFESFLKTSIHGCKRGDKDAKREFNIDLPYLMEILNKQEEKCAITGFKMTHIARDLKSVSIDRIDNSVGHIKGNVQLICQALNLGKKDRTDLSIREFVQEIKDFNWTVEQAKLAMGT